jgi:hypothetical protein
MSLQDCKRPVKENEQAKKMSNFINTGIFAENMLL